MWKRVCFGGKKNKERTAFLLFIFLDLFLHELLIIPSTMLLIFIFEHVLKGYWFVVSITEQRLLFRQGITLNAPFPWKF